MTITWFIVMTSNLYDWQNSFLWFVSVDENRLSKFHTTFCNRKDWNSCFPFARLSLQKNWLPLIDVMAKWLLILSYLLTTFSTVFCKTAGRNPVLTRPVLIGYTNKILKGSEALNDSNTAIFLKQFTLCQSHIRDICKVIQCISLHFIPLYMENM